jgi:hypothetical protein
MVRVEESLRNRIRKIAEEEGKNISGVIAEAIERLERDRVLRSFNAAYARLKSNPGQWQEAQEEREELDSALMDGLDQEA